MKLNVSFVYNKIVIINIINQNYLFEDDKYALRGKRAGRGAVLSGLTHECGVFGAIATEWPTQVIYLFILTRFLLKN